MTAEKLQEFLDYLKTVLDSMTATVQQLRQSLG